MRQRITKLKLPWGLTILCVALVFTIWRATQLDLKLISPVLSWNMDPSLLLDPPHPDPNQSITKSNEINSANPCQEYSGILHIREGDENAGAGTLFFVYVINHILYAKEHNLLPWIHFKPVGICYDNVVHNTTERTIQVPAGIVSARRVELRGVNVKCVLKFKPYAFPGNLTPPDNTSTTISIAGNGIWSSYFEPAVPFDWKLCQNLPVVQLERRLVSPGIHRCAPWSVRPWQFDGQPVYTTPQFLGLSTREWLGSMRSKAHAVVSKYFKPQPWLAREIDAANSGKGDCLAMHIRMTDKGHGRKKIALENFLPYAQAYVNSANATGKIYVATDDERVLEQINSTWPKPVASRVIARENTLRSRRNVAPVFKVFAAYRHRTNTEALVEMYALSQCNFIVHGYSAIAEAAIYLNGRHEHAICLDDEEHMSPDHFQGLVKNFRS